MRIDVKPPPTRRSSASQEGRAAIWVGLAGAAVGLIYGYDTGAIAGALLFLRSDFGLSTVLLEVVTSAVVAGSILGTVLARPACDRLGRQRTMVIVGAGYALFAALSGMAPTSVILIGARFLLGIAIGGSIVAAPIFISESVAPRVRGRVLVSYQMAVTFGIAAAYFVDFSLAESGAWRWMLGMSAIPAVLVSILVARLPETGYWHLLHGDPDAARQALRRTRPAAEVEAEIDQVRRSLAGQEHGSFRELFQPPYRRAGIFVVGLGFFVQITGIPAILSYSPMIFKAVGITGGRSAIFVTALVQLAAIVGEVVAILRVDRAGRRPALLTGIGLMAFASLVLCAVFIAGVASGHAAFMAVGAILLFRIGYSAGFGALVWVYATESLPLRLRSVGATTLLTVDLLANFIITLTFLSTLKSVGGSFTFGLFFALCVAAGVFAFILAPETKGRELEDIEAFWHNGGHWSPRPAASSSDPAQSERDSGAS